MGENQWKVNEAAKLIDESQHVVRHWLKELGQYIPTKKGENGYRYFDYEAMDALRIVQRLTREQNFSIRQVEHYLATGGKEFAAGAAESPAAVAQSEEIQELREMVEKQSELMAVLVQRLDEHNRKSEERAEQRDRVLMNTLREIQERNRILLEEKNDRPWWKFWS